MRSERHIRDRSRSREQPGGHSTQAVNVGPLVSDMTIDPRLRCRESACSGPDAGRGKAVGGLAWRTFDHAPVGKHPAEFSIAFVKGEDVPRRDVPVNRPVKMGAFEPGSDGPKDYIDDGFRVRPQSARVP